MGRWKEKEKETDERAKGRRVENSENGRRKTVRYKPRVEHGERQRIRKTRNEIRRGRWGEAGRVAASSPRPPTLNPRTRPAGPGPVQPAQPGRVGGAVLRASGAGAPAHRVLRGPQAQGGAVVQHDRALLQVQLRPRPTPTAPAP